MNPVPDPLEQERTALIVIDLQERLRPLVQGMPQVLAVSSRLVRFCEALQIPVIVTEQYPQGLGSTATEIRELLRPFMPIEKIAFSCALEDAFRKRLEATGRRQVVLCGIEAHVCIYQTGRDLLAAGYQVVVAADAVSSRRAGDREIALWRLRDLGAQIMSAEMIMFEVLRVARTEQFKRVAEILKEG